jgi:hypothetical protein
MQDLRTTFGVALAVSLAIIIVSGFFVTSSREFMLVFAGFASGLICVYILERLKFARMHLTRRTER